MNDRESDSRDNPAPPAVSERAEPLKEQVREFWNQQSCDTQVAQGSRFSREYFEEIESFRYFDQPFIHAFAQFTRYHGKRVLEVGFGAGTDFVQWLRAGAQVSGIDLTPEALANLTHRIKAYDLPAPASIQVADAERLPFAANEFDLGYSFGVLHHSPDTEKALAELVRVIRPGGDLKIMLYNRSSIYVINRWIRFALLKGRLWKSLKWILWNHVESVGTKGYTRKELASLLQSLPLEDIEVNTVVTAGDYLSASALWPLNFLYRTWIVLSGYRYGWHPNQYVARVNDPDAHDSDSPKSFRRPPILFTGNPRGFFHCISAKKRG